MFKPETRCQDEHKRHNIAQRHHRPLQISDLKGKGPVDRGESSGTLDQPPYPHCQQEHPGAQEQPGSGCGDGEGQGNVPGVAEDKSHQRGVDVVEGDVEVQEAGDLVPSAEAAYA